jgi:uncharacterized protein (TIGR04255 family)
VSSGRYRNPPIQEAILDVFTELPADLDLAALAGFGEKMAPKYSSRKPRHSITSKFQFNPEEAELNTAAASVIHSGYIFRTPSADKAVQARLDGYTFNRLAVYDSWHYFSSEARALWDNYVMYCRPTSVKGIGLRFLNRIELPIGVGGFQDYCTLFPSSTAMPKQLSQYSLHYAAPSQLPSGGLSVVTVTLLPPTSKASPLLVDINVRFEFQNTPTASFDWQIFESLREEKNLLFEKSITDKARALFD